MHIVVVIIIGAQFKQNCDCSNLLPNLGKVVTHLNNLSPVPPPLSSLKPDPGILEFLQKHVPTPPVLAEDHGLRL